MKNTIRLSLDGTMKIRGKFKDVKTFLRESIHTTILVMDFFNDNKPYINVPTVVIDDDKSFEIFTEYKYEENYKIFQFKNSSVFLKYPIEITTSLIQDDDEVVIVLKEVNLINYVSCNDLVKMSKDYNVDIKIVCNCWDYESDFEIEIIKGELIKEIYIEYENDYAWDSPYVTETI